MGKILMIKTAVFFILAVGILMLPVFWMRWKKIKNLNLAVTAYVLVLVWLTRLAIGLFAYGASALKISDLSFPEKVFDSMVHALQTFSMDEDYASYLKVGKEAIKRAGYPAWASVYGIIVSFLNVCAPVLGGALLLEILAGVFPYIRVRASLFRHVLIFSELNDASITLAEDICQKKNYTSFLKISSGSIPPLLVFTDAYPDRSSEPRSELFERAAAIGAVCIKTDLLHIPLRLAKTVSYFLMDQKADENISTVATLLQKDEKGSYLWPSPSRRLLDLSAVGKEPPARIYIFTRDDAEDEMIQQAHNNMKKEKGNVFVRPIRDHMNTAIYLMYDAPLFLPLIENDASAVPEYDPCAPAESSTESPGSRTKKSGTKRTGAKRTGTKPVETKGSEAKESEEKESEVKESEVKESEAKESVTKESGTEKSGPEERDAQQDLYVSILGNDVFAEEVLKAAFWCGQIQGVQLHIDVLAEDAGALRRRIEDACPEVLKSSREEHTDGAEAGRTKADETAADQVKAGRTATDRAVADRTIAANRAVAGGTAADSADIDETAENRAVADRTTAADRAVAVHTETNPARMRERDPEENREDAAPFPGILTVYPDDPSAPESPPYCVFRFLNVEDPFCCSTYPEDVFERTDYFIISLGEDQRNLQVSRKIRMKLLRTTRRRPSGHAVVAPVIFNADLAALARNTRPEGGNPYILPFADLETRFSYRNIQMDYFRPDSEQDEETYNRRQNESEADKKDSYSYWANMSRTLHVPYKLFGLGIVEGVDLENEESAKFTVRSPYGVSPDEDEELAWIEHRRWNAFMRTQGFTCPTEEEFNRYYERHCTRGETHDFKDVDLRFHPCLVERDALTAVKRRELGLPASDLLDRLSEEHKKDYKKNDYKEDCSALMKYLR